VAPQQSEYKGSIKDNYHARKPEKTKEGNHFQPIYQNTCALSHALQQISAAMFKNIGKSALAFRRSKKVQHDRA